MTIINFFPLNLPASYMTQGLSFIALQHQKQNLHQCFHENE